MRLLFAATAAPAAAQLIAVAFALVEDEAMAATLTLAVVAASTNRSR